MTVDLDQVKIFVRPGITDMRKQIAGLAILVELLMKEKPFSGNLFLFCGRRRNVLKALYWDKTGFCLWQKKLEKSHFPWPGTEEEAREINRDQTLMLLRGIDFWREHQPVLYTTVL